MSNMIVGIKWTVSLLARGIINVLSMQLAVFQTTTVSVVLLKKKKKL